MAMDLLISAQSMIPFTILGFLLFLYTIFSLSRTLTNKTRPRKLPPPPEAGGAWPIIGHLPLLSGSEPPHIALAKLADKYGPIFSLRLGVHPTLIVSSWEMAKECFAVNDLAFAGRPKILAFEVMGYNCLIFAASSYGSYYCHIRKIITQEVLSNQRREMLRHVRESEVKFAVEDIYKHWLALNNFNNSGGRNNPQSVAASREMKKWFRDITFGIMLRILVGKRLSETEDDRMAATVKAMKGFLKQGGEFVISDALPYLRWLDLGGKEKAMKKTAKELDQFLQFLVDEHKRNRDGGSGKANAKHGDFMDVLLSMADENDMIAGHDADTIVKATCLAMFLGGTDTATVTLTWAVSLLVNHPQILKKAVNELDNEIGRERMVEESDLKNLPYLEAIVKEAMRLYPSGPLAAMHEAMKDCTVAGYHIPSGTRLLANLSKIQRDPRVYKDPLEFKPERFLTTNKDVDLRGQNFELIPFGAGRRICPGITFGLRMVQLTLASLLHGFDFETPANEAVDMCEQMGLTNVKASPLELLLTPRLPHNLYYMHKK